MAGPLTDSTSLPPVVSAYFNRKLLKRAMPKQLHSRFARRKPLPQRNTKTMKFRRLPALAHATTPLTEGIAPKGKQPTYQDIETTVKQYGDYLPVADLVRVVVEHPVLNDFNELLGQQSGETIDILHRDEFTSGTVVSYGGNVAGRANILNTGQLVTTAMLDLVIRGLQVENAEHFTQMVGASTKVSTEPIRDAYFAIITPEIWYTLQGLTGVVSVEHYSSTGPVVRGEVGAYKELRFLMTTLGKKLLGAGGTATGVAATGGLADIHFITVFAMNAVAYVPLEGHSLQNIIHPIGSAGAADPLNQVGTTGWKHTGARVIEQNLWLSRLEVAVAP